LHVDKWQKDKGPAVDGAIMGLRSESRGGTLSAKKVVPPPALSKNHLLSRKSTKIGKKLTTSRKIALSKPKHLVNDLKRLF
jgi:hypothetical protein